MDDISLKSNKEIVSSGVICGGALLVGGGSVCDDLGGVSTGDEVMLTSHPELAHCGGGGPGFDWLD